ncbi:TRAM domain-containing protein [Halomonas alkalisoli]|uniref:TRAM domain-containing protein n=1 Tax=Halomonas alkalisoli TaxID=2907158 RepID=UPI001F3A5822|nr:TRAM domain-containing protein [Halomonas alkalisoli]MCE9683591.1 TRAM domain-containing protein [Halomonas alkalisoli]
MAMLGKRRPPRQRSGVSGLQGRSSEPPVRTTDPEVTAVTVQRLAHDGRGVARSASGKTLFIEGALPGERLEVAVHRSRKRFDEAHVRELLEASPERVEPPCPHYAQCGGCDLQHLAVAAQRQHKQAVLVDLLAREGISLSAPPALLAGASAGYRRRARLGVKVDAQGRVHLGFRVHHTSRLVDVEHCLVLVPSLEALLVPLRQLLARLEAPRQVGHLELVAADDVAVVVVRQLRDNHADRQRWLAFAREQGVAVGQLVGRDAPVFEWLGSAPDLAYRLPGSGGDLKLFFGPGDFLQVNEAVNAQLVATTREWLAPLDGERVLDLYAGVGNFSLPMAADGSHVTAVEGNPAMVERLVDNARINGLPVDARQADLSREAAVVALLEGIEPDAVVLDPPRDGAAAACRALVERPVARLVYVACDPATLARDAARLVHGGYRITRAAVADMFVHTSHLESILLFEHCERQPPSQGA